MSRNVLIACISAAATVIVALLSALAAYLATKRERRRMIYSEAVKSALAWREMLYRVRRRTPEGEAALVQLFHELQEQLAFHQAWVGSESKYMKRSYDRLVNGAKSRTESLITQAWSDSIRTSPGNAATSDENPNLDDLSDAFLRDVRAHLSPLFFRKIAVAWRNRKGA